MSLFIYKYSEDQVTVKLSGEELESFKVLVRRGIDTWAKAPPEMRELHDILIHGEVLQNYYEHPYKDKQ